MSSFPKIIFIVGPTAVGKTDVAAILAQKLKGEVISCDSAQVYKEIHIASNKPPAALLRKVPHHLMNIISIRQDFDVAAFNRRALQAVDRILKKKKIPVITGGSGLYMSILLDGIFQGVTSDELLRKKLEAEADRRGNAVLYDRLKKVDPDSAAKIHLHDRRRIIRALEVYMKEKKPLSTLKKERSGLWGKFDIRIFVLNRDRAELYDLINRRVDAMLKEGLVEEIRSLMKRKWSPAADKVIGVRQIKGFLRGEYDLNRACYLMKLDTRHFAKRQLTWFRKDKRLEWIDVRPQDTSSKVVARILEKIKDE